MKAFGNLAKPGSVDISMKSQIVNILVMWPVTAPQLCHSSTKAVTDNSSTSGCGCAQTLFMDSDSWISSETKYYFSFDFLKILSSENAKTTLGSQIIWKQTVGWRWPMGGVCWSLGYSIGEERMVVWSGVQRSISRRLIDQIRQMW